MTMIGRMAAGLILALGMAAPAMAADPADPALKGLTDCAAMGDVAAKAACYDAATAALNGQVKSGEIIIVRKKEAVAAQRGAFGFNLPSLNIFDRASGGEKKDKADKVSETGGLDSLVTEVKTASQDGAGHWTIVTVEGAVWRQIDNETLSPRPHPGSKVEIKRASFGSYLMKIDRLPAVRAKRSE